jgi:hypothetical protein
MFGSDVIRQGDTLLYAFLIPAGEYEIFQWSTSDSGEVLLLPPVGPLGARSRVSFSIRFKSTPGKATYIGNLYMPMVWEGKKYTLKVRDNRGSEISLFRRYYPYIAEDQIETRIMDDKGAVGKAPEEREAR